MKIFSIVFLLMNFVKLSFAAEDADPTIEEKSETSSKMVITVHSTSKKSSNLEEYKFPPETTSPTLSSIPETPDDITNLAQYENNEEANPENISNLKNVNSRRSSNSSISCRKRSITKMSPTLTAKRKPSLLDLERRRSQEYDVGVEVIRTLQEENKALRVQIQKLDEENSLSFLPCQDNLDHNSFHYKLRECAAESYRLENLLDERKKIIEKIVKEIKFIEDLLNTLTNIENQINDTDLCTTNEKWEKIYSNISSYLKDQPFLSNDIDLPDREGNPKWVTVGRKGEEGPEGKYSYYIYWLNLETIKKCSFNNKEQSNKSLEIIKKFIQQIEDSRSLLMDGKLKLKSYFEKQNEAIKNVNEEYTSNISKIISLSRARKKISPIEIQEFFEKLSLEDYLSN